jgi:hypothetical protein
VENVSEAFFDMRDHVNPALLCLVNFPGATVLQFAAKKMISALVSVAALFVLKASGDATGPSITNLLAKRVLQEKEDSAMLTGSVANSSKVLQAIASRAIQFNGDDVMIKEKAKELGTLALQIFFTLADFCDKEDNDRSASGGTGGNNYNTCCGKLQTIFEELKIPEPKFSQKVDLLLSFMHFIGVVTFAGVLFL